MTGRLLPDGRAVMRVAIAGHPTDAIIDTKLHAGVSLPHILHTVFGWAKRIPASTLVGGGSDSQLPAYEIEVEIDGTTVQTDAVLSRGTWIRLGAKALTDNRLTIDYPAGTVTLERTRP